MSDVLEQIDLHIQEQFLRLLASAELSSWSGKMCLSHCLLVAVQRDVVLICIGKPFLHSQ